MYDEIDIEDQKPVQLPHISQIKFIDGDSLSPSTKRARLDINYSIAPTNVFTANGSAQATLHKPHFQQLTQQQILQQQQNRRKMTLVNRIA